MVWSDEEMVLDKPTYANRKSRLSLEWLSFRAWKHIWIMVLDIESVHDTKAVSLEDQLWLEGH